MGAPLAPAQWPASEYPEALVGRRRLCNVAQLLQLLGQRSPPLSIHHTQPILARFLGLDKRFLRFSDLVESRLVHAWIQLVHLLVGRLRIVEVPAPALP